MINSVNTSTTPTITWFETKLVLFVNQEISGYYCVEIKTYSTKKKSERMVCKNQYGASVNDELRSLFQWHSGQVILWQVDFIIWIYGTEYRRIPSLSIKAEYEKIHDEDDIGWHEFHLDVSYAF